MLDVSFEVNGRKVRPGQFGNAIEKETMKLFADHVRKAVKNLRCPVHGERPRINCKGRSIKDLEVEVYGCCDELTEAVKAKF